MSGRPGELPGPLGGVAAPPGVPRRRGDLARVLDRRALRGLDPHSRGPMPTSPARPGTPTSSAGSVRARSPSTRCGCWPTWRPLRPTAAVRAGQGMHPCVSWPTSPAAEAELASTRARFFGRSDTMVASCASTTPTAPSAPSCRRSPTPRPRPARCAACGRSLRTERHLWTSVARRLHGDRSDAPDKGRRDGPAPMSWSPTSPWTPWSTTQARRAPWPASSSTHGLIDAETVRGSPVTPPSSSPSTTTSGTPCTRDGPDVSRAMPSAERSCAGTDIVASRAVPT